MSAGFEASGRTRVIDVTSGVKGVHLEDAAKVLFSGGLVVYPTETCYGLGALALNPAAVKKVFEVKKRICDKPIHVLVASLGMARGVAYLNPVTVRLASKFWPGPLTIVLKKKEVVPDVLTSGLDTVGLRLSSNRIATALVKAVGTPITSTSSNISGDPEPYAVEEALRSLGGKVDLALNAGRLPSVRPSTVIDLSSEEPRFLREGPVSREAIAFFLGKIETGAL